MVLSSIVCKTNLLVAIIPNKIATILGKCKNSFQIIIVSWLSGYVIGPKLLCEEHNDSEVTDFVFLASNAGIGFVISYIGIVLWQSISFGLYLYFIQIFSSLLIFKLLGSSQKINIRIKKSSLSNNISDSVRDSTKTVLEMCGFTVMVTVLKELVSNIIGIKKNGFFSTFLAIISEVSTGVYSATFFKGDFCGFFVGFSLGFGGICMFLQTFSVCKDVNISKFRFISLKFVQGLICGILSMIYVQFSKIAPVSTIEVFKELKFDVDIAVINAVFIFSILCLIKKVLKSKFLY